MSRAAAESARDGVTSAADSPATMPGLLLRRCGGAAALERVDDLVRPEPGPGEVLVKVHRAGLNPVDRAVRETGLFTGPPPLVPGWDVAGEVVRRGLGVARFAEGQVVFGLPRFPRPAGAFAEYVTAPAGHLAVVPEALGVDEAAALPLAGLTAWQALVETARIRRGERVLVRGAAGGVGHLAVQIARACGAEVLATARAAVHDLVRGWGAEEVLDREEVPDRPVDVVLDAVGGPGTSAVLGRVRAGGRFVTLRLGEPGWTPADVPVGVRAVPLLVEPDRHGLHRLAGLVTGGELAVHVDRVVTLDEVGAAQDRLAAGPSLGKVVVRPAV